MRTAIIILAAGKSSRLGQPKQLLETDQGTLLSKTVSACIDTGLEVFIVLGAHRELILPCVPSRVKVICNEDWSLGMGKSIAVGVSEVMSDFDGVVVTVADQPYLEASHITQLLSSENEPDDIVVSRYSEGQGPPVYFGKKYFKELMELEDDNGARPVVRRHIDKVKYVTFPKGNLDIDTMSDVKNHLQ